MQLLAEKFFYAILYLLMRPVFAWVPSTRFHRIWAGLGADAMLPPGGQQVRRDEIAGVPCELRRHVALGRPDLRILYAHGGWYCIGSAHSHRAVTGALARDAHAEVVLPEYRLAPEHPAPAALEDVLAVYRAMCEAGGPVALAGDSAGGGLALALAHAIRDAGLPAPVALYLISPYTDLTLSGASHRARHWRECLLSTRLFERGVAEYLQGQDARDPRHSPLFAEQHGLPATLIQVGSEEMLFDDSKRLAARLRAAGVPVELEEFDGLWHDFQVQNFYLARARNALANAGAFLQRQAAAGR